MSYLRCVLCCIHMRGFCSYRKCLLVRVCYVFWPFATLNSVRDVHLRQVGTARIYQRWEIGTSNSLNLARAGRP